MSDRITGAPPPRADASPSRRDALLRLCAIAAAPMPAALLQSCGGGSSVTTTYTAVSAPSSAPSPAPPASAPAPTPTPAPPPPAPSSTPIERLKAALQKPQPTVATTSVAVSQGSANSTTSSFGASAAIHPPLDSPGTQNLATIGEVYGFRRDLWTQQGGAVIEGHAVVPVSLDHVAATLGSSSVCGLHFVVDGAAFELLVAGSNAQITLLAEGQYQASGFIATAIAGGVDGAPLANPNDFIRFDFGSAATRHVSVYARSAQGPCAIAVASTTTVTAWDRSAEASFAAIADSYGGATGPNWGLSGPFWEAAALLGIPHLDLDAIGGTGYAANDANVDTRNTGNDFVARAASIVAGSPDLFLASGGINDNNSIAAPPLYATAADALAAFDAAVTAFFTAVRRALPNSVIAATGPWAPRQFTPTDPVAQSKADTIEAALRAAGGPWIFVDNLNGGWRNSAGASAAASGAWQTGTGTVGAPAGDGNGDLYVDADGTHPTPAGCAYLGGRLASDLRAALLAL